MSGWTKLRFKILAVFSLFFFFIVGLLKQILSYLFIAIFFILIFFSLSYASTWQDVLTAYYNARVQYPSPEKIWIEQTQYGYRLWRRPRNLNEFKSKYKYTAKGGYYPIAAGTQLQILNCDDTSSTHLFSGCDTCYLERGTQFTVYYSYCDGSESPQGPYGVVGDYIEVVPCLYQTTYKTVNCKSNDVLIQEFFNMVSDCTVGNTMTVGSSVYGGDASKGCDCTPEGTVYADNSSGNCKYTIITGDPSLSPPKINGDVPGFTHITTTTTSPPVTNPDGSTTVTTTNTFPDGSQDVKTSITVNNITTKETVRYVGGVSIGTVGTSTTTNYADNSSRTVATNSTGTTATTLTGGGVSQTNITYGSGLSVTSATGGSLTGNVATSGGGTGTGGGGTGGGTGGTGGSGTVTIDPETSSAVVPTASEKPAYSDSRLAGAEGKTFGDFGNLFTDFSNGVKSTSLFSRFNFNDFSNSISGAASSPTQSINFGRFGAHDVDLSTYDSSFYIIKGIMLILASYLATRIVILKR